MWGRVEEKELKIILDIPTATVHNTYMVNDSKQLKGLVDDILAKGEVFEGCPICGSGAVVIHVESFDYGTDPETGYSDCGEDATFTCGQCGATGEATDCFRS